MRRNKLATNTTAPVFIVVDEDEFDQACRFFQGTIYITAGCINSKFVIAHEVGHKINFDRAPVLSISNDYSETCPGCPAPCQSNSTGHALLTKEWSSAAVNEGLADFYSAYVWNNYCSSCNCVVEQAGLVYSCRNGDTSPPIECTPGPNSGRAYMENCCHQSSNVGRGNQLDWTRTFWNMINPACVQHNSITQVYGDILTVIKNTNSWTKDKAYEHIDEEFSYVNDAELENCWNIFSSEHGIDH